MMCASLLASATMVEAQSRRSKKRAPVVRSGPENALAGIALYDAGTKVIKLFGSPDEITAVSIGGGAAAGGGGGEGAPKGPSRGGGGASAEDAARSMTGADGLIGDPFGETGTARQSGANMEPPGADGGGGGGGAGGGGGSAGGGTEAGGAGGAATTTQFTRWIYRRATVRYGFVLDKFNKVVQIEAIGLNAKNVRTKRGISFGNTMGDIQMKYDTPDGYEIAGDTFVMRYLTKNKVAFRLARLKAGDKHRVTGIVVAAGKK